MVQDDEKFVRDTIQKLPTIQLKQLAWSCYQSKYKGVYDAEPLEHKKENIARRTANNALRNYVNRAISRGIN